MSAEENEGEQGDWPLGARPGYLIRRAHQIHGRLFQEHCEAFAITPVQYSLLSALARRSAADQTTLAADIVLDRTTTTGALLRLARRDLAARARSEEDRRAQRWSLTDQGARLLRSMRQPVRAAHEATLAVLSSEEQALFMQLLAKLVDADQDGGGAGRTSQSASRNGDVA